MRFVVFAFFLGALGAFALTFFFRCAGQFIFKFGTEAFFFLVGSGRKGGIAWSVRGRGAFFVSRFACGVVYLVGGEPVRFLESFALLTAERFEVGVIVVGVVPDGAGWVGGCVDEELVAFFAVELADPA